MKGIDVMAIFIITAIITIIMLVLISICFFDLGYIAKELILYKIRELKEAKKINEQLELARKIIDNQDKF